MDTVIARSRSKAGWALVGCAAFVAVSVALIASGHPVGVPVGVLGAVTFGAFGVLWAALGLRSGPGLLVDDHGFDDRSSAVAVGRVPWSDVVSVGAVEVAGVPTIVVRVHDPEAYVGRVRLVPLRTSFFAPTSWVSKPVRRLRTVRPDFFVTLRPARRSRSRLRPPTC